MLRREVLCYNHVMRKIEKNELKKACEAFADMFADYKTYSLFFSDGKTRSNGIYWFFRFEVYGAVDYTYADDDFLTLACVKRPGDRSRNTDILFFNPFFAVRFLAATGIKALKLGSEYLRFAEEVAKKYYNPETDCYVKNVGVAASARGQGRLRKAIDELCGDRAVYLETHSQTNVEIYRKLGFELCETAIFHGAAHYAMRRPAKADVILRDE